MTYIGVPLIVGGLIVKKEDDHFRSLRNDYLPQFNHHVDDYLQFSPAIAMLGMKAMGVKSRSSWGKYNPRSQTGWLQQSFLSLRSYCNSLYDSYDACKRIWL